MEMNSLPRWLISITHMPVPCQSSISSPARERTSAGNIAGPALKLKIRDIRILLLLMNGGRGFRVGRHRVVGPGIGFLCAVAVAAVPVAVAIPVAEVALVDALQAGELLAFAERNKRHALR